MSPAEFRALGHQLVDDLADQLARLPRRRVTPAEPPHAVRAALGAERPLPEQGQAPGPLLRSAAARLFEHSLFNGHPRFFGYITSSAAPIGALADLLAAAVNPNVGGWTLSPFASELEAQTVRWIAELIGYPVTTGGLLVSGGNVANLIGLLVARTKQATWDIRKAGLGNKGLRLRLYTSTETHTWIQKAADLSGLGTDAICWIPTNDQQQLDPVELRRRITADRDAGEHPFLVIGTAGSVSTGAVDPLPEISRICQEFGVWFHVGGRGAGAGRTGRAARSGRRRLGCDRPPQVAVCTARGGLHSRTRSGGAATHVFLPSRVLPPAA
jgi:glutamate/tyrosine decarboxylase-like PLP-dependent enzyme